jgi:hypothetical protein
MPQQIKVVRPSSLSEFIANWKAKVTIEDGIRLT